MSKLGDHIERSLGEGNFPVKSRALAKVLRYMADALDAGLRQQNDRIAALERKIEEAQRKGFGIRYAGVYRQATGYEAGQFVTHQGGLWHCNENTSTRPGTGPHWTLAVKSGEQR